MVSTRLSELRSECDRRGIALKQDQKYTKAELVSSLAQDSLRRVPVISWSLMRRMAFSSPMLSFRFDKLSLADKRSVLVSEEWIAEPKYYGVRCILCYSPDEGFAFYGQNVSESTFLPLNYTGKILLAGDKGPTKPVDWKGRFDRSFVLDCEIYSKKGLAAKPDSVYLGSQINHVNLILSQPTRDSYVIQIQDFPLTFACFDCLFLDDEPVWGQPLISRKKALREALGVVRCANGSLPLEQAPAVCGRNKQAFFMGLVERGWEGVILKNVSKSYLPAEVRHRDVQIKLKRSMSWSSSDPVDLDVFISGYDSPGKDDHFPGLIKSLRLSAYMKKEDCIEDQGSEEERCIAIIDNIPIQWRINMSEFNKALNRPELGKDWFGRVLTVSAIGVDPATRRLIGVKVHWEEGVRADKTRFDCVMDEPDLRPFAV